MKNDCESPEDLVWCFERSSNLDYLFTYGNHGVSLFRRKQENVSWRNWSCRQSAKAIGLPVVPTHRRAPALSPPTSSWPRKPPTSLTRTTESMRSWPRSPSQTTSRSRGQPWRGSSGNTLLRWLTCTAPEASCWHHWNAGVTGDETGKKNRRPESAEYNYK